MNMDIHIVQADITTQDVDAIVNAANRDLSGGYGVDGAIFKAAGPELKAECKMLGKVEIGQAKITRGYELKAKLIIHTVGPNFTYNPITAPELLRSCYQNTLSLAESYKCKTLAIPSISTGKLGYPVHKAAPIALKSVLDHTPTYLKSVTFCLFDETTFEAYQTAFSKT